MTELVRLLITVAVVWVALAASTQHPCSSAKDPIACVLDANGNFVERR